MKVWIARDADIIIKKEQIVCISCFIAVLISMDE